MALSAFPIETVSFNHYVQTSNPQVPGSNVGDFYIQPLGTPKFLVIWLYSYRQDS